jgi:hypothetical protein
MKKLCPAIIFALLSSSALVAQQPLPSKVVKLSEFDTYEPARCADRTATLQGITQDTPADELITVVARLGDGDSRPDLSWRRLANVRAYWTEFLPKGYRRKPETILLIQGESVKGHGHLEFYVRGKLVWVLKVARNSDVDFGNCYPPDDSYIKKRVFNACRIKSHRIFYPCRDISIRRRDGR